MGTDNKIKQILLSDLVTNTGSNSEGSKLYQVIEKNIDCKILIKTKEDMGFSSSFLNSSIGVFIDRYGFQKFKDTISFICSKKQFEQIRSYIDKIQAVA